MQEGRLERGRAFLSRMVPTYWGWAIVAALCYIAGFTLAGLAMAMVWEFGEGLGITPWQQKLYGAGHAAIHIVAILTCFCIGGYLMEKRKTRAAIAMLIVMVAGGYGTTNIAGFAAKNRVAVSDAVDVNNARAMAAYEAQRADLQNRRNWAENIVINVNDYSPADRLQAKKKVNEYQKQLDALRPPTVTASTVTGDASMSVYARLTGWASNSLQAGAVVWFAVLMFIGEVYILVQGTDRAAKAWAREPEPAAEPKKTHPASGGSSGSGGRPKLVQTSEPKQAVQGLRTEPARTMQHQLEPALMQSPATIFFSTDAHKGKPSRDAVDEYVRQMLALGDRKPSQRAMARELKWSQSTISRAERRLRAKAERIVRRYPGNGGGMHVSAIG